MLYIKNPVKFLHSQIFSSIEHWWLTDLRLHLDYFHAFGCQILHYLVSSATFRITVSYLCCFYSSLSFLQMWACTKDLVPNHRITVLNYFSSVQFSHSVMSDYLRPHESQKPGCPVHHHLPEVTDSRPSSPWCHPAISASVVPFSSCPQSLSASESFPMTQLFSWGGQSTGVSALASFLPKKSQGWSPSEWTGWITLQFKGLSRVFSNTTLQKHQFFGAQPSSQSNSHIHTWPQEKP